MTCWKVVGRGWRYQFRHQGKRYGHAFYQTKGEARAAEAEHKKRLKVGPAILTPTGTGCREAMNEYLDFCKRRFSEKNYKEKVFIFRSFLSHLGGEWEIRKITARDIIAYLGTRPGNANWNKHRKSLCAYFQWCFKHGFLAVNPCLYVDSMPEDRKQKSIPTQEEMLRMLLAAGKQRVFLLALYSLAGRLGEVNNLRWQDVNFEKRQVTLWTRKGRTGEWRPQVKHMNQEIFDELKRLYDKRSTNWVFPNHKTGLPYKNRRKQIANICQSARVPDYGWHSVRHHVASLLADKFKASLPTIQKLLGHTQVTTTSRYIQSLGADAVEAAERLKIDQSTQPMHTQKNGNEAK